MLYRSPLVLSEHLTRSPLRLLGEMDERLRQLERQAKANPGDSEAQERYRVANSRAGLPSLGYHWRWNGKGWYTRPSWNSGRCPPASEPTNRDSCLDTNAHPNDAAQYRRFTNDQVRAMPPGSYGSDDAHLIKDRTFHGFNVNGPVPTIRGVSYSTASDRPLPDSPEHLPITRTGDGRMSQQQYNDERAAVIKHYVDRGYHPGYVSNALGPRAIPAEPPHLLNTFVDDPSFQDAENRARATWTSKDRERQITDLSPSHRETMRTFSPAARLRAIQKIARGRSRKWQEYHARMREMRARQSAERPGAQPQA